MILPLEKRFSLIFSSVSLDAGASYDTDEFSEANENNNESWIIMNKKTLKFT